MDNKQQKEVISRINTINKWLEETDNEYEYGELVYFAGWLISFANWYNKQKTTKG